MDKVGRIRWAFPGVVHPVVALTTTLAQRFRVSFTDSACAFADFGEAVVIVVATMVP